MKLLRSFILLLSLNCICITQTVFSEKISAPPEVIEVLKGYLRGYEQTDISILQKYISSEFKLRTNDEEYEYAQAIQFLKSRFQTVRDFDINFSLKMKDIMVLSASDREVELEVDTLFSLFNLHKASPESGLAKGTYSFKRENGKWKISRVNLDILSQKSSY